MSKTIEERIQELFHEDKRIRDEAVLALAYLGEAAIPALIEALRTTETNYEPLCIVFSQIGYPSIEPLTDLLRENVMSVQMRATYALARIADNRAVIPLIVLLSDDDVEVRAAAAGALGNFNDARAVGPLLNALTEADPRVRAAAAKALGNYEYPRVVPSLIAALRDPETSVRQGAIWALAHFHEDGVQEALNGMLNDPDSEVRQLAAAALQELKGDKLALERLVAASGNDVSREIEDILTHSHDNVSGKFDTELMRHSNPRVRARLLEALGKRKDASAAEAIIPSLNDINPAVRATGVQSLVNIGLQAVEPLIAALDHKSKFIRQSAAEVLGLIGDNRAVQPLIAHLSDPDTDTRIRIIEALAHLKDPEAIPALYACYSEDKAPQVRAKAEMALVELGETPTATDNPIRQFIRRLFRRGDS